MKKYNIQFNFIKLNVDTNRNAHRKTQPRDTICMFSFFKQR